MCCRGGEQWRDNTAVRDVRIEKERLQYFQPLVSQRCNTLTCASPGQMGMHMLAVKNL